MQNSRFATTRLLATALIAAASYAQVPQVKSWPSSKLGEIRTQISIQSDSKLTPAPVLLIECNRDANRKPAIGIYLVPGLLKPHPKVGILNSVSEWLLLTKLDDGKPTWLSWVPVGKTGSYAFEGEGENALAAEYVSPKHFIKELLDSKCLDIQIQRAKDTTPRVLTFDTSQLKQTFETRQECDAQ